MTSESGEDLLEVSVVTVRGKKRVGFDGVEHLQADEAVKDELLQRYEELILALDDLADEYGEGPDRAWHIGRILDQYGVSEDDAITIADIARYNTIGVNERRMNYCRDIYRFFPDQEYDPSHTVTALGDLASRAKGQDREEEAKNGYSRLVDAGEALTRRDVFAWQELGEAQRSLEDITAEVITQYDSPTNIVASIRRVLLLLGEDPAEYSSDRIRATIKTQLETQPEDDHD